MKKIVKMSLVAAVAVAGLTTANAKPLEEAIKNVDVSGTVVYRYNDYNNDAKDKTTDKKKGSSTNNNYKIGLNLSSKVNDDVKLNTRFLVGGADGGFATLNTQENSDSNVDAELSNIYFSYTGIMNTTVNVGKQGLTTPWTVAVDSDGNEQTGTGILALSTWGPVTVAAAYFNQTNLGQSGGMLTDSTTSYIAELDKNGTPTGDLLIATTDNGDIGSKDIYTVGVIGNAGPVTLNAWYLDMEDIFDTYTLGANAGFDVSGVKLGADLSYTSLELDNDVAKALAVDGDNDIVKLILTAKAGIFDAKYMYAGTDKEGGITALDKDATTTALTWNITTLGKADADLHNVSFGVQAMEQLHVSANYTTMEYVDDKTDMEEEELYAQLVYNMSKNLSTYVRFGTYTKGTDKNDDSINDDLRGRLQVQYSF
jgi:hypothetical protein